MSRHLGEAVAAVADGHVTGEDRERALAHLAACPRCRHEVEQHRAMRQRLTDMAAPEPPAELRAQLLRLSIGSPTRPVSPQLHRRTVETSAPAIALARPASHAFARRPAGRALPAPRRTVTARRRRLVAAGVLAAAAVGGGAVLGARPPAGGGNGPVITPGSLELTRFDQSTRSVMPDDPAPALAVAANR